MAAHTATTTITSRRGWGDNATRTMLGHFRHWMDGSGDLPHLLLFYTFPTPQQPITTDLRGWQDWLACRQLPILLFKARRRIRSTHIYVDRMTRQERCNRPPEDFIVALLNRRFAYTGCLFFDGPTLLSQTIKHCRCL